MRMESGLFYLAAMAIALAQAYATANLLCNIASAVNL